MDNLSYHTWRKHWLQLCGILVICVCSSALLLTAINTTVEPSAHRSAIKNREKREAKVHDSPVIFTGTNQLEPNVAERQSFRVDSHATSIVNRYSVNSNVQQPFWNATVASGANISTSIRFKSHLSLLRQPLRTNAVEPPQRQPLGKNVLHKESLATRRGNKTINRNQNRDQQHVSVAKQSLRYGLNNGSISNRNSKPKNSIKIVKSNLSKQIIDGHGVAGEPHGLRVGDSVASKSSHVYKSDSSMEHRSRHNKNQVVVRGEGGAIVRRKYTCIPCRVIPGQPTRRVTSTVAPQAWAWNRGMFSLTKGIL